MKGLSKFLFVALVMGAVSANAEVDKKTERLWKAKCASCHGATGKGDTDQGKKMEIVDLTSATAQKKSDADWKKVISDGYKKDKKEMDPYKDSLSTEQIDALVKYMRTFK